MYSRRAGRVGRRKEYEHATVMRIKGSCNERGERIRVGVSVGVGALEQRPYKDVWTFLAFPESRVAHLGTGAKRVNGSFAARISSNTTNYGYFGQRTVPNGPSRSNNR